MHSDKIVPLSSKERKKHFTFNVAEVFNDTPQESLIDLKRAAVTADTTYVISADIPGIGVVKDVPIIRLSPNDSLAIGDTWLAILKKQESK